MELTQLLRSKNFNFTLLLILASIILQSNAQAIRNVNRGDRVVLEIANPKPGAGRCDWTLPQFDHTIDNPANNKIEIHEMANDNTGLYDTCKNNGFANCTFGSARPVSGENIWLFTALGSAIDKTKCGIDILRVSDADSGEWEGDDDTKHQFKINVQGPAYITIAQNPPDNPSSNNPITNVTDTISETVETNSTLTRNVTIWCIARESNPEPNINVFIGNENINSLGIIERKPNMSESVDDDFQSPWYPDFSSVVYKFTRPLKQSYDGKELRCESTTSGFNKQVMAVNISIEGPPSTDEGDFLFTGFEGQEIGSEVNLTLEFHSNPVPSKVQWFVHDQNQPIISLDNALGDDIEIGNGTITKVFNESSRYASTTIRKLEGVNQNNRYLVQLQLRELEKDDEDQTMTIEIENSIGKTNFTVVHQDLQRSGLSNGAIAGIVVGVVLGVLLVGAVIFFVLKKKGKKSKNINRTNPPIPQQRGRSDDEMIEIQQQQQQQGVDNPAMSDVEIN